MKQWKIRLSINEIIENEDLTPGEVATKIREKFTTDEAKAAVKKLCGEIAEESLELIMDDLEMHTDDEADEEEIDYCLGLLYDWADDYDIWIGPSFGQKDCLDMVAEAARQQTVVGG